MVPESSIGVPDGLRISPGSIEIWKHNIPNDYLRIHTPGLWQMVLIDTRREAVRLPWPLHHRSDLKLTQPPVAAPLSKKRAVLLSSPPAGDTAIRTAWVLVPFVSSKVQKKW